MIRTYSDLIGVLHEESLLLGSAVAILARVPLLLGLDGETVMQLRRADGAWYRETVESVLGRTWEVVEVDLDACPLHDVIDACMGMRDDVALKLGTLAPGDPCRLIEAPYEVTP